MARTLEKLPTDADPRRRQLLEDLQQALATFTAVQYSREPAYDATSLEAALGRAIDASRRSRSDRSWPKSYLRQWVARTEAQQA